MVFRSIEQRIQVLEEILVLLERDCLEYENSGNESIITLNISGKLRTLLANSGQNKPLLILLAKDVNIPLRFYARALSDKAKTNILSFTYWSVSGKNRFVPITLEKWLTQDFYFTKSEGISYKNREQLIRRIAETEGSSHFSEKEAPLVAEISQGRIGLIGENLESEKAIYLIDIAYLTIWLGKRLIYTYRKQQKHVNEIDIYYSSFKRKDSMIDALEFTVL